MPTHTPIYDEEKHRRGLNLEAQSASNIHAALACTGSIFNCFFIYIKNILTPFSAESAG